MIFLPDEPQRRIRDHLFRCPRALLFVGMGLGKTAAVLATLKEMIEEGMICGALIIAPLRVCNLTWPMEVENWEQFSTLKVANLRTPEGRQAYLDGSAHLYLANYEALQTREVERLVRREPDDDERAEMLRGDVPVTAQLSGADPVTDLDRLAMECGTIPEKLKFVRVVKTVHPGLVDSLILKRRQPPFDVVVFDESTRGKNPAAKGLIALRKALATLPTVRRRWALTGTPAPNSCFDLFAQTLLVDQGARLGGGSTKFKEEFFIQLPGLSHKWVPRAGAEEMIQQKISDITLTLHTKDWLDLPDTVIEDIEVPLGDKLQKQYRAFEKELVMQLATGEITAPTAAALVTKLLQFTSGAIYDGERSVHALHDLKVQALRKLVEKHPGEPLLVAVAYQHEYDALRTAFPQAQFVRDFKSAGAQKDMLERWNAKKIPMLVSHPASCGHGLNMQHGCKTMVWYSLTYNREYYDQMLGRLYRRGQTESVTMYRLMCPGTVDEAVAESLAMKAGNEARLLKALAMLESVREQKEKI